MSKYPFVYFLRTEQYKNVDNFIEEELKKYNLPISKIDERFTSELIKNSKKDRVDDLSALEILETYIKNND